jgi:hypothetical protein
VDAATAATENAAGLQAEVRSRGKEMEKQMQVTRGKRAAIDGLIDDWAFGAEDKRGVDVQQLRRSRILQSVENTWQNAGVQVRSHMLMPSKFSLSDGARMSEQDALGNQFDMPPPPPSAESYVPGLARNMTWGNARPSGWPIFSEGMLFGRSCTERDAVSHCQSVLNASHLHSLPIPSAAPKLSIPTLQTSLFVSRLIAEEHTELFRSTIRAFCEARKVEAAAARKIAKRIVTATSVATAEATGLPDTGLVHEGARVKYQFLVAGAPTWFLGTVLGVTSTTGKFLIVYHESMKRKLT